MPITVRKFNAQVKDPESGDMIPAGLLSSDALGAINSAKTDAVAAVEGKQAVAEAAIELKGQTTLASIPDDYTALSNEVDDVKTHIDNIEDAIFSVDNGSDFTWESGTYNATTGAANSTGNAIRVANVNYYTNGSTIKLNSTADSTYSLRVLVMDDPVLTGSDRVKEALNGSSLTTSYDGYLRIVLIKNGINGDTTQKSKVDFSLLGKDKIITNEENIAKNKEAITFAIEDVAGYKKPNLIPVPFPQVTVAEVALTVNDDWSVNLNGTPNSNSGQPVTFTLSKGKYILNGISGGATNTFFFRLLRADGSYKDLTDGEYEFEVTDTTEEIKLYIRVTSVGGATINTTVYPMIRDASIYDGTYAKYGEYAIYKPVQSLIDYTSFNWSGKKMNALGDSIVKGSNGNFINVIGGILNLSTVRNYGIGGSRIASSDIDADYPPAVLRYTEMDNDADIILVHAGTNDYTGQIPIGETNSTDITTWNGALNVLMDGLRTKYPFALIVFSNILDRIHDKGDSRYPIECQTYRDALEAACRRNHMVFYNGFEELNFDFHKGYYDHYLTVDGLHPNQAGANIMGRSIAGFIKWH